MAKPEWGTKRVCDNCDAKFYDFQRDPIICPKCETKLTIVPTTRSRRSRTTRPQPVIQEAPKVAAEEDKVAAEIADVVDDDDDDDAADDTVLDDDHDFDEPLVNVDAGDDQDEKSC